VSNPLEPRRSRLPFILALAFAGIVTLAVYRLTDAFVVQLRNNSPLSDPAAGWAYRLIVAISVLQALYAGWAILRPERVRRAMAEEETVARLPRYAIARSVCRNAAGIASLTVIYGVAVFLLTGLRGGFLVFPLLALLQIAWYFRQAGVIAGWLAFQQEPAPEHPAPLPWSREPADYCPPLARGLRPEGN
jgi:cytochrome bd-type quinol oxidase subunit 2